MENLNKYISSKMNLLNNSDKTFQNIFNIMHDQGNRVFAEITDGYRVKEYTYNDIKKMCIKRAFYFNNILKETSKGEYIGLLMENSLEWIANFWGLLMAGYKPMLLNKRLSKKLNNDVIEMIDIKTIICDEKYGYDVEEHIVDNGVLDKTNIDENYSFEWANEIALSTSATSLNVKVCVYDGETIASQIMNTKRIVKANPMVKKGCDGKIKILAFLPFYHVFGLVATYFWFAFFGRIFVFLKDYSTETILKTVRKHKVTHVFAVPMLWHGIYREVIKQVNNSEIRVKKKFYKGIDLSLKLQSWFPLFGKWIASKLFASVQNKIFGDSIQFMITGGGYISPDAMKIINGIGYPLYNGYGMSEIGIASVELRKKASQRIIGTVGRPFESIEYKIDDNSLLVRGKSLCKTIIQKDNVYNVDKVNWFNTGDVVSSDAGYYNIKGRKDDVVIGANGEKINPDLLEKNIFIQQATRHCVLGLKENDSIYLSLVIEIKDSLSMLKRKKLREEIDNNLNMLKKENYNIERVYYTYDAIAPVTAVKVGRSILHKLIDEGNVTLNSYEQLDNCDLMNDDEDDEVQKIIKNVMAELLNIEASKISSKSHYIFDLGGTSLDYLSLLVKLKEEFEVDFKFDIENGLYTVDSFAKYIKNNKRNEGV